jgi:hypothetical protein
LAIDCTHAWEQRCRAAVLAPTSSQTPSVLPENTNLGLEAERHVSENGGLKEQVVKVLFQPRHRAREKQTLQDDHHYRPA